MANKGGTETDRGFEESSEAECQAQCNMRVACKMYIHNRHWCYLWGFFTPMSVCELAQSGKLTAVGMMVPILGSIPGWKMTVLIGLGRNAHTNAFFMVLNANSGLCNLLERMN